MHYSFLQVTEWRLYNLNKCNGSKNERRMENMFAESD